MTDATLTPPVNVLDLHTQKSFGMSTYIPVLSNLLVLDQHHTQKSDMGVSSYKRFLLPIFYTLQFLILLFEKRVEQTESKQNKKAAKSKKKNQALRKF